MHAQEACTHAALDYNPTGPVVLHIIQVIATLHVIIVIDNLAHFTSHFHQASLSYEKREAQYAQQI